MKTAVLSILTPTRKRPVGLKAAVESMRDLARHPDQLEFLFRADDDDPTDYSAYPNVRRGPRHGYKQLHKYYNELSELATGSWLVIWNDDLVMLTRYWDELIRARDGQLCVQFLKRDMYSKEDPANPYLNIDTAYPVYPKRLYSLMGHVSLNCHCDSWLCYVSEAAGIKRFRHDIWIHHDRPEDETAAERVYDWEAFQNTENGEGRGRDILSIQRYLADHPEERPQ